MSCFGWLGRIYVGKYSTRKQVFVAAVTLYRSSNLKPTTHAISPPVSSNQTLSFSNLDSLLLEKKSCNFCRLPPMPSGQNQSPGCQWRSRSGNWSLSASNQAVLGLAESVGGGAGWWERVRLAPSGNSMGCAWSALISTTPPTFPPKVKIKKT